MLRKRLLLSLIVISLPLAACDELLPAGEVTSPEYWADFFLDKYEDELIVDEREIALEAAPEPLAERRPVLLITGVTIPARWFDPIVARLQRDGFDPVVYEPPELLSYDLFEASEDLADVVERLVEETGVDRIDILAECTGGVIARYYIQSLGGDEYVDRMVTFVSPQHGVDKAPMARSIAGWEALYDLSPGSDFLTAVNEAPLPENVAFTSIYTCSDEYIQPYETSIIPGATNIGLCDEFVGHFQTFYDAEIYLIMHGALTEPLEWEEAEADGGLDPFEAFEPSGDDTIAGTRPEPTGDDASVPELSDTDLEPSPDIERAHDPYVPFGGEMGEMAGCSATGSSSLNGSWLGLLAVALVVARRRDAVR